MPALEEEPVETKEAQYTDMPPLEPKEEQSTEGMKHGGQGLIKHKTKKACPTKRKRKTSCKKVKQAGQGKRKRKASTRKNMTKKVKKGF